MDKDLLKIVAQFVAADMNENDMKISEDTMAVLALNSKPGTSQGALDAVRDWFNGKSISKMPYSQQQRYVGAAVNILTLVAKNDMEELVKNWVLVDM